jgi:hypothetical protein
MSAGRYNIVMIAQLNEHLDREPFRPFRIITTSGDRYEVLSPREVAVAQTYLFYAFPRSDRSAHVRLNQIVALETMEEASRA